MNFRKSIFNYLFKDKEKEQINNLAYDPHVKNSIWGFEGITDDIDYSDNLYKYYSNYKARQSEIDLKREDDEEESDDEFMPITIPTISKAKPQQYSKWLSFEEFKNKFEEIEKTQ